MTDDELQVIRDLAEETSGVVRWALQKLLDERAAHRAEQLLSGVLADMGVTMVDPAVRCLPLRPDLEIRMKLQDAVVHRPREWCGGVGDQIAVVRIRE